MEGDFLATGPRGKPPSHEFLSQAFGTQPRPGRQQLFYKQEAGRGHGRRRGSVPGRPLRVLLAYTVVLVPSSLVPYLFCSSSTLVCSLLPNTHTHTPACLAVVLKPPLLLSCSRNPVLSQPQSMLTLNLSKCHLPQLEPHPALADGPQGSAPRPPRMARMVYRNKQPRLSMGLSRAWKFLAHERGSEMVCGVNRVNTAATRCEAIKLLGDEM